MKRPCDLSEVPIGCHMHSKSTSRCWSMRVTLWSMVLRSSDMANSQKKIWCFMSNTKHFSGMNLLSTFNFQCNRQYSWEPFTYTGLLLFCKDIGVLIQCDQCVEKKQLWPACNERKGHGMSGHLLADGNISRIGLPFHFHAPSTKNSYRKYCWKWQMKWPKHIGSTIRRQWS